MWRPTGRCGAGTWKANKYLTKEGLDKQALLVYNGIRKKRKGNKMMTTYQLIQITNRAGTINPWIIGSLIALGVAFIATAIVVMIKMW